MKLILLVFLVFLGACKDTHADSDAGLYDPVAPAGSSFVRFLNAKDQSLSPSFKKKKYSDVSPLAVSPYYVFKKGDTIFKLNNQEPLNAQLEEGAFYTITSDSLVIKDQPNANRAKATIVFYNLSTASDLSLKAKEGKINIFEEVASQSMEARDMNAVKIDLGVYSGDEMLKQLTPQIIERGNHYSVVYTGDHIFFATAETNTRD